MYMLLFFSSLWLLKKKYTSNIAKVAYINCVLYSKS